MIKIIPQKLKELASVCNGRLYVVGGACRDYLAGLKRASVDLDICAPLPAEEVARAALSVGMEIKASFPLTGSLKLVSDGTLFEFTSFRKDIYSGRGHRPSAVEFTKDISVDALRRDFKCNAVYYDVCGEKFIDPLGGADDIAARRITAVACPQKLFGEDALRILRLARFCGELGFSPDDESVDGAARCAELLRDLPTAFIRRELDGILLADKKYSVAGGHAAALEVLARTGGAAVLFKDFRADEKFFASFALVPENLRLEALLVASCAGGDNISDFVRDMQKACKECAAAGYPVRAAERSSCVASLAAFGGGGEDKVSLRRFLVGKGSYVAKAARLARIFGAQSSPWLEEYEKMLDEGVPFGAGQLAVGAEELLKAGFARERTAEILRFLLGECATDGSLNERERLIALARRQFGDDLE